MKENKKQHTLRLQKYLGCHLPLVYVRVAELDLISQSVCFKKRQQQYKKKRMTTIIERTLEKGNDMCT